MCILKTSRPHPHSAMGHTSTYGNMPPSSISSIFNFPFVMCNFMCQLGWPRCPAMWLNIILNVSVRVFLNEIKHLNQWILLSIVDRPLPICWRTKKMASLKPEDRGSLFSRHTLPQKIEKVQRNNRGPFCIEDLKAFILIIYLKELKSSSRR